MNIHLSSDHAGFELKEIIEEFLISNGYTPIDHGPNQVRAGDDYPDTIPPAVQAAVANNELAIVLGGSGQGEAMVANKTAGARAVVYYGGSEEILRLSREHNNANILSLGARFLTRDEVIRAIEVWLEVNFLGEERHVRRLQKLSDYESQTQSRNLQ